MGNKVTEQPPLLIARSLPPVPTPPPPPPPSPLPPRPLMPPLRRLNLIFAPISWGWPQLLLRSKQLFLRFDVKHLFRLSLSLSLFSFSLLSINYRRCLWRVLPRQRDWFNRRQRMTDAVRHVLSVNRLDFRSIQLTSVEISMNRLLNASIWLLFIQIEAQCHWMSC